MTIQAKLSFSIDTGQRAVAASVSPEGRVEHEGAFETRAVAIHDGRAADGLALEREGFELVAHDTRVRDFLDPEQVRSVYYREAERLIADVSGAERAVIFDHTVRSGDEREQSPGHLREPVQIVHNDYTEWSGPNRLRLALPEEADALLTRRFAIVQVWRAVDRPVSSDPLAVCDARTVRPEDLLPAERRHAHRVGEIYLLAHHADQRWLYFPNMRPDEALVFKVYDSETDGRARFTPHGSFVDPTTPADALPRRSIEVRGLALF